MNQLSLLTEPMVHQTAARDKLAGLKFGALFMEMGTGKTLTAFMIAADKVNRGKASRLIYICPCSVKEHIIAEAVKHGLPLELLTVYGCQSASVGWSVFGLQDIVPGACVVADESHMIKNGDAIRTKRLDEITDTASSRYIMTGTPMPNGVIDLYSQFKFLSPIILGYSRSGEFEDRHVNWVAQGQHIKPCRFTGANMDYIESRIGPYVFQCSKEDCLDLPAKTYQTRIVEITPEQREAYEEAKHDILGAEDAFTQPDATVYRLFTALQRVASGYWHKSYEHPERTGHIIPPARNPRIRALLECVPPRCLVFCKFRQEVIDICTAIGPDAIPLMGGYNAAEALERFKLGGVLVATQQIAGTGLDIPFCSDAIFFSNQFDWKDRIQSEGRIHRIGSSRCSYVDITTHTGIDKAIMACLKKKQNACREFAERLRNGDMAWLKVI
jgi:hypothetical protein